MHEFTNQKIDYIEDQKKEHKKLKKIHKDIKSVSENQFLKMD